MKSAASEESWLQCPHLNSEHGPLRESLYSFFPSLKVTQAMLDPTVLLTSHPIGAPVVPVGMPKVGPVILSPIPPSFNPKIGELETTS